MDRNTNRQFTCAYFYVVFCVRPIDYLETMSCAFFRAVVCRTRVWRIIEFPKTISSPLFYAVAV